MRDYTVAELRRVLVQMGCTQPELCINILLMQKTQEKLVEAIEQLRRNCPQFFEE
jgi:hypothetical protein